MDASTGPVSPERQPRESVSALLASMEELSARPRAADMRQDDHRPPDPRLLASLAEHSPNAVLRLDADGRVLYANPAAQRLLAACAHGRNLPAHWADLARETCASGLVRSEEVQAGDAFYDLTFAPAPDAPGVHLYAADITRGRHAKEAAREAQRKFLRALEQAVGMLARALEQRDPYTFRHQQRVAAIAVAIAGEMDLEPRRIEGLRLGAAIHDIGKLHTPAELLARPGKLLAQELELIRQHPLAGHEIVKDADFPWPVAQIVLQHHERMDGTGYPHGLQGEQILLEARIVAVADVVDGMSAHRPFRPALGLAAALQEIERMRGRWLDAQAVDACLRLFRERGFQLPP